MTPPEQPREPGPRQPQGATTTLLEEPVSTTTSPEEPA